MKHHAQITLTPEPQQYDGLGSLESAESTQVVDFTYERLGIGEVRQLIEEAHRQPLDGFSTKLIIIRTSSITIEAQQAALKILEEPPSKTAIQLVLPTGTTILPTVLSRVVLVADNKSYETSDLLLPPWLASSYKDRIAEIADRAKPKILIGCEELSKSCGSISRPRRNYQPKHSEPLILFSRICLNAVLQTKCCWKN